MDIYICFGLRNPPLDVYPAPPAPTLHQTCNSRSRNKVVTQIDALDIVEKGFVIDRAERPVSHGASLVSIFTEISAASGTIQSRPLAAVNRCRYIKNNDVVARSPLFIREGGLKQYSNSVCVIRHQRGARNNA